MSSGALPPSKAAVSGGRPAGNLARQPFGTRGSADAVSARPATSEAAGARSAPRFIHRTLQNIGGELPPVGCPVDEVPSRRWMCMHCDGCGVLYSPDRRFGPDLPCPECSGSGWITEADVLALARALRRR